MKGTSYGMILRTLIFFSGFPRVVRAVDCAVAREESQKVLQPHGKSASLCALSLQQVLLTEPTLLGPLPMG